LGNAVVIGNVQYTPLIAVLGAAAVVLTRAAGRGRRSMMMILGQTG
jgi:hypothetical protein